MIPLTGWDVFDKETGVRLGEAISRSVYMVECQGYTEPYIAIDFVTPGGDVDARHPATILLKRPQPAEPDPAPKHPHTEALERLVGVFLAHEWHLEEANVWSYVSFQRGVGPAIKAAQDALEGNQ